GAGAAAGAQALVAVARRQPDVDQRDVGPYPLDQVEQLLNRFRLAYDIEISLAQDPIETLADEERVFGDRHARPTSQRRRRMRRIARARQLASSRGCVRQFGAQTRTSAGSALDREAPVERLHTIREPGKAGA